MPEKIEFKFGLKSPIIGQKRRLLQKTLPIIPNPIACLLFNPHSRRARNMHCRFALTFPALIR